MWNKRIFDVAKLANTIPVSAAERPRLADLLERVAELGERRSYGREDG
jgi:hypothetical protein